MCFIHNSIHFEVSISIRVFGCQPFPASLFGFLNLNPKSYFGRDSKMGYCRPP
jgi:hypothetical protein